MRMRLLFMGRKQTAKEEKHNGTADEEEEEELLIESERKVSAVPGQGQTILANRDKSGSSKTESGWPSTAKTSLALHS